MPNLMPGCKISMSGQNGFEVSNAIIVSSRVNDYGPMVDDGYIFIDYEAIYILGNAHGNSIEEYMSPYVGEGIVKMGLEEFSVNITSFSVDALSSEAYPTQGYSWQEYYSNKQRVNISFRINANEFNYNNNRKKVEKIKDEKIESRFDILDL